jgi:UDP-N-acetyl-2-amino-2-deoxyglucuronate dehydrogenase
MQRIGILGCGRVSRRYLEVCRDELKDATVTVVCDLKHELAQSIAAELNAEATYSLESLLQKDNVDVIVILTESGKHGTHARQILEAGKHVIVEKPAAMLPDEVLMNEQLAAEKELMYAVIHQNRLNPALQVLKKHYDSGRFGKIVLATIRLRWCRYQEYYNDGWHGTWAMDGGVLNQQAIHHLDALEWICGPIDRVVAAQSNALNQLEAEDTTVATVKFVNGALGNIEVTTAARPEDFEASISIVGENGMVVVGGIALNQIETWKFVVPLPEDSSIPVQHSQKVPSGYGLSHGPMLQELVDRLNEGRLDPLVSGTDAVHCIQLSHAIYCSVEEGGWVQLVDNPLSSRLGKVHQQ